MGVNVSETPFIRQFATFREKGSSAPRNVRLSTSKAYPNRGLTSHPCTESRMWIVSESEQASEEAS